MATAVPRLHRFIPNRVRRYTHQLFRNLGAARKLYNVLLSSQPWDGT
jgi:hypothetical protein